MLTVVGVDGAVTGFDAVDGVPGFVSQQAAVFVIGVADGICVAAIRLFRLREILSLAQINGIGVSVPFHIYAQKVCHGAHGQVGGAVVGERLHGLAGRVFQLYGFAVQGDFDVIVFDGNGLVFVVGNRGAHGGDALAAGSQGNGRGCAVPTDGDAQCGSGCPERQIGGAVPDKRLYGSAAIAACTGNNGCAVCHNFDVAVVYPSVFGGIGCHCGYGKAQQHRSAESEGQNSFHVVFLRKSFFGEHSLLGTIAVFIIPKIQYQFNKNVREITNSRPFVESCRNVSNYVE